MNFKRFFGILGLGIMLAVIMGLIGFNLGLLAIGADNYDLMHIVQKYTEFKTEEFRESPAVKNVYYQCKDNLTKTECVFDAIPFVYDYGRMKKPTGDVFLRPDQMIYYAGNGVCRDIAVFRKAALDLLSVSAIYKWDQPNHLYLYVVENNKEYILSNEVMNIYQEGHIEQRSK